MPRDEPPSVDPRGPVDTNRKEPAPVSTDPGDGALHRDEANKDELTRRWDPVSPSATVIGRARSPEEELGERIRRLHEERHPAMAGHGERMHRLDKARITQALCNRLGVGDWERDRALGLVLELDLTEFGSQRAVATVALVVLKRVIDHERQRRLGLHDQEWVRSLDPELMSELYDRFRSLADEPEYRDLLDEHGLDVTTVNRLNRVLGEQIERRGLEGAVLGRGHRRDPHLPDLADR